MSESAKPKPASRLRTAILCACFILAVLGIAWTLDGWLLARLRIIANDTFTNGNPEHPGLFMDGRDELKAYPPNRLAKFLTVPSSQIRVVVCLSLSERGEDPIHQPKPEPQQWVGIAPRLIRASKDDSNSVVRNAAKTALASLPIIPAEDVEAVLEFVEGSLPGDELPRTILLSKVVRWHQDRLPRLIAYYQRCFESGDRNIRSTGFFGLRTEAPKAPETLAAFRNMMDAGDPDGVGSSGANWMLEHHPELIDEFLIGNAAMQRMMFNEAFKQVQASYMFSYDPNSRRPNVHFSEPQLQKVDAIASRQLNASTPVDVVRNACDFLFYRSNGDQRLLEGRATNERRDRAKAIYSLFSCYRREKNAVAAAARLDEFLGWLLEGDSTVQESVISFVSGYHDREWLKSHRTGHDAPIVEACRKVLDRFPNYNDSRVVEIIIQAAPTLRDDDIDRIAEAACRSMKSAAERTEKAKGQFLDSSFEANEFERWLRRFPEHRNRPSVKTYVDLRADFEKRGVLARFVR